MNASMARHNQRIHDFVIIGAGSAGCVLAARLSASGKHSVLLLEAGPDHPVDRLPPEIRSGWQPTSSHDWGYVGESGDGVPAIELWRGKLVGGCSATNATVALRGRPADFDAWAALGNPGWAFDDVLPVFCSLENDFDFAGPWHGSDGPLPIRRYQPPEWVAGQAEFAEACAAEGHDDAADHNAPGAVGIGPVPVNTVDGLRRSTSLAYLAAARSRQNLTVRSEMLVDRIALDAGRAVGVRLASTGETIAAHHVVLSAGAYGSPAILWRSGIGPAADLRALGIAVRHDLPGVGDRLCDHPRMGMRFAAPRTALGQPGPGCQVLLTMASPGARDGHDLHLFPWSISEAGDSPTGARFTLHVALMTPLSRGRVRLRSPDPAVKPVIEVGWLSDGADLPRLLAGVRAARRLAAQPSLAAIALRELTPGPTAESDVELGASVRANLGTYFHPVGTCAMGPVDDAAAVVDARGAVHGVEGLWVVDASIMPTIPAANTQLATIMLAERCARSLETALSNGD